MKSSSTQNAMALTALTFLQSCAYTVDHFKTKKDGRYDPNAFIVTGVTQDPDNKRKLYLATKDHMLFTVIGGSGPHGNSIVKRGAGLNAENGDYMKTIEVTDGDVPTIRVGTLFQINLERTTKNNEQMQKIRKAWTPYLQFDSHPFVRPFDARLDKTPSPQGFGF